MFPKPCCKLLVSTRILCEKLLIDGDPLPGGLSCAVTTAADAWDDPILILLAPAACRQL